MLRVLCTSSSPKTEFLKRHIMHKLSTCYYDDENIKTFALQTVELAERKKLHSSVNHVIVTN